METMICGYKKNVANQFAAFSYRSANAHFPGSKFLTTGECSRRRERQLHRLMNRVQFRWILRDVSWLIYWNCSFWFVLLHTINEDTNILLSHVPNVRVHKSYEIRLSRRWNVRVTKICRCYEKLFSLPEINFLGPLLWCFLGILLIPELLANASVILNTIQVTSSSKTRRCCLKMDSFSMIILTFRSRNFRSVNHSDFLFNFFFLSLGKKEQRVIRLSFVVAA